MRKFLSKLAHILIQAPRIVQYRMLSTCCRVEGTFSAKQPVVIHGKGRIVFRGDIKLGYRYSPGFYDGSIYIEARNSGSVISFGRGVRINNNVSIIAEGDGVEIGDNVFIGMGCVLMDTDGHPVDADSRLAMRPAATAPIRVGNQVFIGNNVTVLKGVSIGDNSVIAAGSVVTKSLPANVVCGGVPARVIKEVM